MTGTKKSEVVALQISDPIGWSSRN